ncbi:hypothetical protein ACFQXA_36175 [Nocardiopsis composta]
MHAAYAPSLFQQEVLDRFDLVGYNPRGWRADCFDSAEQEQELLARLDPAPLGGDGVEQALAAHRELGEACARNEGSCCRTCPAPRPRTTSTWSARRWARSG